MELMIRPMHDSETGAVAQLFHDVWHETQAPLQDTRKAAGRDLQFFMARIALRAARTQVAVVHGKIEGFFSWTDNRLDSLFVSRGARSMGIGQALCGAAESAMCASGHRSLELDCVYGNWSGRRFYERLGWKVVRMDLSIDELLSGRVVVPHWQMAKEKGPA
ncbi:MAG: GNAT family N-acetyltransferase [Hyphomicrobiales bacterium]